jgi:FtsP/CotA-like multicopper oxidase with cupredoxin domain
MSSAARVGVLVATVAVLVLAFVLLSPGDDDSQTVSTPTVTAPVAATPDGAELTTTAPATPEPLQEFTTIRVRNGEPSGGVKTITVEKGERARIQVASQDTSDEVHLHGYDITRDLKAGDSVRFSFEADAEGVFEIELEGAHALIGKLVVEP